MNFVGRVVPRRLMPLLGGLLLTLAIIVLGIGATIDRAIDPVRFSMFGRTASGQISIVEMDAAVKSRQ